MNNSKPNKIDTFFRQALGSAPDLSPAEKDWEGVERLLQFKPKRRPTIVRLYLPIGIAMGLLIFVSVWLFREPETRLVDGGKFEGKKENRFQNSEDGITIPEASLSDSVKPDEASSSGLNEIFVKQENIKDFDNLNRVLINRNINQVTRTTIQPINRVLFKELKPINNLQSEDFTKVKSVSLKALKSSAFDRRYKKLESSLEKPNERLTFSMAFSTDLNTVNALSNSKAGLSFGIGMNYKISKLVSVGTALYYSQKKYTSDRYSYNTTEKPFSTWASYSKQIDASCKVIDIPLNVNILLSKTKKMGILASAGLSSYIMLSEKYDFIYNTTPSYPSPGKEYTIKNANQHILSIVNLSVGIEKPVGKQSSIVIQPYAKLPLSGIGQGETDLKSFGIGFQLNYSMKKKKKFFNKQSN